MVAVIAITSAIHPYFMGKNIFPYTFWCYKICKKNIFFRPEELTAVSKSLSKSKIIYSVIEKIIRYIKKKQDEESTSTY